MRPDVVELWKRCEGQTIEGKFPLSRLLHPGEDSAVFLSEHNGRKAGIKILRANPRTADLQLSRWGMIAKLSHPNVVRIFASGRWRFEGSPMLYVVMEHADEDLSQVLPERALSPAEAQDMLNPAVSALQYVHREGLVHGHIRPSNVMAVDDQLKISSDGLCRLREAQEVSIRASVYDPPEIDAAGVSPAGDMWSLGVMLVEVLTQQLPEWNQADQQEPALPDAVPEPFREIAQRCLQRNPKSRWTASQVMQALHPETVVAAKPRQASFMVRYGLAGVALVIAVLGILLMRGAQTKASNIVPIPPPPQPVETVKTEPPKADPPAAEIPKPKPAKVEAPKPKATPVNETQDSRSAVVHEVIPEVPRKAKNSIHGKVTVNLKLTVDPSGSVQDAIVLAPESSKFFSSLCLKAAKQWKFREGSASQWAVRFDFTKSGTKTAVQPR